MGATCQFVWAAIAVHTMAISADFFCWPFFIDGHIFHISSFALLLKQFQAEEWLKFKFKLN